MAMDEHALSVTQKGRPVAEDHAGFRRLLSEFAMVCLQGGTIDQRWSRLERHLDSCADCREELQDLLELLDETYTGTLASDAAPTAHQAFARWSAPTPISSIVTAVEVATASLRQILIEFTDAIRDAVREPSLGGSYRSNPNSDDLLPSAASQAENSAKRDPDDLTAGNDFRYELPNDSTDDSAVAIDLMLSDQASNLYDVKVTVIIPDRDPYSQDGHRVALRYEVHEAEELTDSSGCVLFRAIPYAALPHLQITVTPRPPDA